MYAFKGGSRESWELLNPVLPQNTIGVVVPSGRYKVGDGRRRWLALPLDGPESYPKFRRNGADWEQQLSDGAYWTTAGPLGGKPGTSGTYPKLETPEAVFFYRLVEGERIPYVPPSTGDGVFNPDEDVADAPFAVNLELLYQVAKL